MRVLIVSFDKTLTENLKGALSDHEVFTAKNSEEAIKMIPSDMDVVIYDAISGAISEEDINTLYTKKFSNSKFLILYDELFPVDPNNITVLKKILVSRTEDPKTIGQKIFEEPSEEVQVQEQEVQMEETVEETVREETPVEEKPHSPPAGGKLLVVSFDQTLIDTIRNAVGPDLEIVSVKTVRQAIDQGKDASVVVFDAISGIIAEKGLVDMSKDETMAKKPYVILVDDLFPINVEGLPLEKKFHISRDADPSQIRDVIARAFAKGVPAEEVGEAPQEEPAPTREEEVVVEAPAERVEDIVEREIPQDIPEIEIEQVEEEAPALQALEKIMEEKKEELREEPREVEAVDVTRSVEEAIRQAVTRSLSEEKVRELLTKAIEEKMEDIRSVVAEAVRSKIDQVLEEMDIKDLIRQTAYKALRDRLDELVT
ncbi:MAG: hypothetical protein Q9N26_06995 [Aquificota bacterium]|nr:hypothetical protein [Aquificota bacterium]